ncbi:MAG: hypothetical protein CSA23_04960 [Deltaproteobacteria bacterium]|nr:MAG: hypothetical protein CSA23_04960 [Deltaproteobacteria bacterium]
MIIKDYWFKVLVGIITALIGVGYTAVEKRIDTIEAQLEILKEKEAACAERIVRIEADTSWLKKSNSRIENKLDMYFDKRYNRGFSRSGTSVLPGNNWERMLNKK